MGLSVDKTIRTAFFEKYGALSRGNPTSVSPEVVVIDVSAVLRQLFPAMGVGTKTPVDLARYFVRKHITPFSTCKCIVVAFDSYSEVDLHQLRIDMHTHVRHRKATDEEIAAMDADTHVIANGRIFKKGQQPYSDAEVAKWHLDASVLPERAVAGKRGKLKLYDLVLGAMVREVAEHVAQPMTAAAEGRRVIFDTPGTYDNEKSVIIVSQRGDVVDVAYEPRVAGIGRHGEADQKCAAYLSNARETVAAWITVDFDAVAQCMALNLGNVHVCYSAPRGDKDRRPQIVQMGLLPLGPAAALAMVRDGGDYNRSAKVFNLHSEHLLAAVEGTPPLIRIDDGRISVDQEALFGFLQNGRAEKQRKRKLFHLEGADDEGEYFLSRSSAQQHAAGHKVVQAFPSPSHFQRSVHEALRTVIYWMFGGTSDSTTRPTMSLDGMKLYTEASTADTL